MARKKAASKKLKASSSSNAKKAAANPYGNTAPTNVKQTPTQIQWGPGNSQFGLSGMMQPSIQNSQQLAKDPSSSTQNLPSQLDPQMLAQLKAAQAPAAPPVDQLAQYKSGIGAMPSDAELRASLEASIGGQIDPQIAALQKAMSSAKTRAKGAGKDVSDIYNELMAYEGKLSGEATGKNKARSQEAKGRAAGYKSAVTNNYTKAIEDQIAMMQGLGQGDLTGDLVGQLRASQAEAQTGADQFGAQEQSQIGSDQAINEDFYREGQGIAKMQGAEARGGIIAQLQDYLNQQGAAVAGLQGQRQAGIEGGLLKAKSDAEQRIWDRGIEAGKLGVQIEGNNIAAGKANAAANDNPLATALSRLGSDAPRLGKDFALALQRAGQWSNSSAAKAMYGEQSGRTKEQMAQILVDDAINRGLKGDDLAKFQRAALAYYGRG